MGTQMTYANCNDIYLIYLLVTFQHGFITKLFHQYENKL